MSLKSRAKRIALNAISVLTAYDAVIRARDLHALGGHLVLDVLVDYRRKVFEMSIPIALYHSYNGQLAHASWSWCIVFTARKASEGMNEYTIIERVRDMGPVTFSIVYSLPIYVVYMLYFVELFTLSPAHAVVQALFLALPQIITLAHRIAHMCGEATGYD